MKWISVKDERPQANIGEKILAYGMGDYIFECEFDGENWRNPNGDNFTHWAHYPDLPE